MAPQRRTTIWLAVSSALCASAAAHAQIRTDGTLGAAQTLTGPNYAIPATLGRQAGANLFHSFGQFNVPTAGSATFSGPGTVANIISRVTGADASSINGRLASSIQGANLFLINPRGILFGPNASLDLTGSFYASTANYLRLADGTRFDATATTPAVLSMAPPAAFGFLGPSAAPISVEGSRLQTAAGQSINLFGGPIQLTGASLSTAAGDIRIVGVGGAGEVSRDAVPAPSTPLGRVTIETSSVVADSALNASGQVAPPGRIVIRGGELRLADSLVFSESFSTAAAPAVELTGSGNIALLDTTTVGALAQRAGRGADLVVRGENVTIERGATVQSLSNPGAAGDIDIAARDTLRIVAAPTDAALTAVLSRTQGPGDGGAIRLQGNALSIESALVSSRTVRSGRGGPVFLEGRDVRLVDGAVVSAEAASGSTGPGGNIQVRATDRLLIAGQDWAGFPSFLASTTRGANDGGGISIEARDVLLSGGLVGSFAYARGNAGAITLAAETLGLEAGGPFAYVASVTSASANTATGNSGPLTVRASRALALDGRGFNVLIGEPGVTQLNTESLGFGRGADVVVESPLIVLDNGARIAAESWGAGDNGSVLIRTHDLTLRGQAELRSIRGDAGTGRSGGVRIDGTGRLTLGSLAERGASLATADDRGTIFTTDNGPSVTGDITINMAEVHVGFGSEIVTASGLGGSGAVRINAQRMKLTAGNISTDMFNYDPKASTIPGAGAIVLNIGESLEMSQLVVIPQLAALGGGGLITSLTTGNGPGGDIVLSAPYILLDEVVVQAAAVGSGRAGNIVVRADDLFMRNGAQIVTGTEPTATGGAGSIEIDVSGRFEMSGVRRLDGFHAGLTATTRGPGDGGNISVKADTLLLDERAFFSSSTEGSSGRAGSIDVRARTAELANGATIRARSVSGGSAGSIHIEGGEALRIFGEGTVNTQADLSEGGNITLSAPRIVVESGGQVVASASGAGKAGQVEIRAGELLHVAAGAIASETTGSGAGGRISLSAPRIEIAEGGRIAATSSATGEAGQIGIRAADSLKLVGGTISTEALASDGGNIDIRAGNLVHLRDSEISTSVGSGQGAGGNILIDPTFVVLENSRIVANAFGGPGGNITIIAQYLLRTPGSLIDASSRLGTSGSVQIAALNTNLANELAALPTQVLDASAMLRESCTARLASGGGASSLVGVGRGGLAASPERFAPSTYIDTTVTSAVGDGGLAPTGLKLRTAQRARLVVGCAV